MAEELELEERVVFINRVAKVVRGGKRLRFSATCVVGDLHSRVGVGSGKASEVSEAVRKASERAKKSLIEVKKRNGTIPHDVIGKCGASKILLKPASPGTGVIACDPVRDVLTLGGIKDILTKSLGSNNTRNLVYATIDALTKLRTKEEVLKLRSA